MSHRDADVRGMSKGCGCHMVFDTVTIDETVELLMA